MLVIQRNLHIAVHMNKAIVLAGAAQDQVNIIVPPY